MRISCDSGARGSFEEDFLLFLQLDFLEIWLLLEEDEREKKRENEKF